MMKLYKFLIEIFFVGGITWIIFSVYWAFDDIKKLIFLPLGILITAIAFWLHWKSD
jgi:hypothetical protein